MLTVNGRETLLYGFNLTLNKVFDPFKLKDFYKMVAEE